MNKRTFRHRRSAEDSGFTLIELLIVIVVLGILAAVVVFALGAVTGKSAKAACAADAKTVETALAAYNAQLGEYPTVPVGGIYATTGANGSATAGLTPYLRSFPSNAGHYYIGIGMTGTAPFTAGPNGEVDVAATNSATMPVQGNAAWVNFDTEGSAAGCNAVT